MNEVNKTDLRELCAAVAKENDSKKLGFLLEELARALGEQKQAPPPLTPGEDRKTRKKTLLL